MGASNISGFRWKVDLLDGGRLILLNVPWALYRTCPVERVKFECGDRGKVGSEFSQRPAIFGGQDFPVLRNCK